MSTPNNDNNQLRNRKMVEDRKVIEKILENQKLDIEVRKQEKAVRIKEIESNENLAMQAIKAQERVQTTLVKRKTNDTLIRICGFIIIFIVTLVFISYAITHDAKDLVIDLMKLIVPLIIGGIGGFYIGKYKNQEEE